MGVKIRYKCEHSCYEDFHVIQFPWMSKMHCLFQNNSSIFRDTVTLKEIGNPLRFLKFECDVFVSLTAQSKNLFSRNLQGIDIYISYSSCATVYAALHKHFPLVWAKTPLKLWCIWLIFVILSSREPAAKHKRMWEPSCRCWGSDLNITDQPAITHRSPKE